MDQTNEPILDLEHHMPPRINSIFDKVLAEGREKGNFGWYGMDFIAHIRAAHAHIKAALWWTTQCDSDGRLLRAHMSHALTRMAMACLCFERKHGDITDFRNNVDDA